MTTQAFAQARDIVRQLTRQEKLYLLNDITAQLIHDTAAIPLPQRPPFPVLHIEQWPSDLPLRREELYDDRGR